MMGENIARNMYSSQGIINYPTQLNLGGHFRIFCHDARKHEYQCLLCLKCGNSSELDRPCMHMHIHDMKETKFELVNMSEIRTSSIHWVV